MYVNLGRRSPFQEVTFDASLLDSTWPKNCFKMNIGLIIITLHYVKTFLVRSLLKEHKQDIK